MSKARKKAAPTEVKSDTCLVIYTDKNGREVIKEQTAEWRTVRPPKRVRKRKAS